MKEFTEVKTICSVQVVSYFFLIMLGDVADLANNINHPQALLKSGESTELFLLMYYFIKTNITLHDTIRRDLFLHSGGCELRTLSLSGDLSDRIQLVTMQSCCKIMKKSAIQLYVALKKICFACLRMNTIHARAWKKLPSPFNKWAPNSSYLCITM